MYSNANFKKGDTAYVVLVNLNSPDHSQAYSEEVTIIDAYQKNGQLSLTYKVKSTSSGREFEEWKLYKTARWATRVVNKFNSK